MATVNCQLFTVNFECYFIARSASTISDSLGKRPSSCFEKMRLLSTVTLKMPPLPRTIWLSTPSCFLISAARLEALGR